MTLLQVLINGILLGGLYALIVSGLSLIFGVMGVPNFAHGEFLMLGAYLSFWFATAGHVPDLVTILMVIPIIGAFGWLVQRGLLERIVGQPMLSSVLLLFGLSMFLSNGTLFVASADYRSLTSLTGSIKLGSFTLSTSRVVGFAIALALVVLVWQVLQKTTFGRSVRSTAQDAGLAKACGIDVRRVRGYTFAIGAAMAAVAGTLVINQYAVTPTIGQTFIVKAFAIAILGGLGSYEGGFIAALLVGILETYVGYFANAQVADLCVYALLVVVLLVLPGGLRGVRGVRRA